MQVEKPQASSIIRTMMQPVTFLLLDWRLDLEEKLIPRCFCSLHYPPPSRKEKAPRAEKRRDDQSK